MEKRRVYQVAKEKKLSSDALISMLKGMGHEMKSHMSVVTPEMLEAITKKIDDEKKSSIEEVQRQKVKETQRKAEERAARQPAEKKDDSKPRESRAARRKVEPASRPGEAPQPDRADDGRRRGKRRGGKVNEEMLNELRQTHSERPSEKPGSSAPAAPDVSGRWRTGGSGSGGGSGGSGTGSSGGGRQRRRKAVDSQAVQESVRKTLSRISEGRTRRRYDRRGGEEGDENGGETQEQQVLHVNEFSTVGELAEAMHVRPAEVMAACLQLGVVVTINQRLDMDTMVTVADEFGFELRALEAAEDEDDGDFDDGIDEQEDVGEAAPRPPVVTVMGHVDHGKTSLLDYLRKTNVVDGESGGITQHIGAYSVQVSGGKSVTFLDTPGHAAFTAMRARGTRVTDLVILIVAADDSVMPQTIEAIDHAKAAKAPIIVALNKCDLPTADPDRIKRELAEHDVLVEEWGGKVACAQISATVGTGIDDLLESVLLEAEVLELVAHPSNRAKGTIVEGQLDKGRGAVATILVQDGTLRVSDPFVTGMYGGRVRALMDESGKRVKEVGPGQPVQVLGLSGVPQAGDSFTVVASERDAKVIVTRRQQIKREQDSRRRSVTLGDLQHKIQEGRITDLNVVVKGDVDGSVEAITQELGGITHEEVRIKVIHSAVGPVSESDVLLASASEAIIIAFHVTIENSARDTAETSGVEIREYSIIYEVIEELRGALSGLLAPSLEERIVGTIEVRQMFSSSRAGNIAGSIVRDGRITRSSKVRLRRDGEVVWEGQISSLRRFKDDVREVLEGFECGVSLEGRNDVIEGDLIEAVEVVETARTL
ncbi:MAG TPA: translation initiation factor IF-2 [Candidatus Latescibacteria bacterium]|nr:translation initiation factor IF-2 [Candidatus Latescibacterota bacterium]